MHNSKIHSVFASYRPSMISNYWLHACHYYIAEELGAGLGSDVPESFQDISKELEKSKKQSSVTEKAPQATKKKVGRVVASRLMNTTAAHRAKTIGKVYIYYYLLILLRLVSVQSWLSIFKFMSNWLRISRPEEEEEWTACFGIFPLVVNILLILLKLLRNYCHCVEMFFWHACGKNDSKDNKTFTSAIVENISQFISLTCLVCLYYIR